MTDDLVKRLRDLGDHASFEPHMHHTAADRIEALEAENAKLKVRCNNAEDDGYRRGLDKARKVFSLRIEELEARKSENAALRTKLETAVEALGVLSDDTNWFDAIEEDGTFSAAWRGTESPDEIARTTLAELMEEKDD